MALGRRKRERMGDEDNRSNYEMRWIQVNPKQMLDLLHSNRMLKLTEFNSSSKQEEH